MRKNLYCYSLMSALVSASFMSQALIVPIYAQELQASKTLIGVIVSASSLSTIFSAPLAAKLSNRFRKKLLFVRIGFFLGIVFSLALYFVEDKYFLVLARFFMGIAFAFSIPLLQALASELDPINRGKIMGIFNGISALGWAFGSISAGVVAEASTRVVFLLSVALLSLGFVISFFAGEKKVEIRFGINLSHVKKLFPIYLTFFFRHTGAMAIWAFFPIYLDNMGATKTQIGIAYFLNMLTQSIAMGYVGVLADRFGRRILVRLGIIGSIVVFLAYATVKTIYGIYPFQLLLGISWAMLYVGTSTLSADHSEWSIRSQAMAFLTITQNLSGIVGPILGGFILESFSFSQMIYGVLPLCFLGLLTSSLIKDVRFPNSLVHSPK